MVVDASMISIGNSSAEIRGKRGKVPEESGLKLAAYTYCGRCHSTCATIGKK